jgi:ABC-type antimicrobial peptide transport system permease subunit
VDPAALHRRGAFRFVQPADAGQGDAGGWALLEAALPDGAVPVIGDAATLTWGLQKRVGDDIPLRDGRGRTVRLRVVGMIADSVLQGTLIMADRDCARLFPAAGGQRLFLIDVRPGATARVAQRLRRALRDEGLDLAPADERLAAFQTVTQTYLAIFQTLGALGLLLGSVGLGALVLRNAVERRGELALLRAVGYRTRLLALLLIGEQGILLAAGTVLGAGAALVAVWPALAASGGRVSAAGLAGLLGAVLVNGLVWVALATGVALRAAPVAALRDE